MTTQLPTREQLDAAGEPESPDVLFEEARRRRRRRWMAGSALTAAAIAAAALIVGIAGGGGGSGRARGGHAQPSGFGSGAGSGRANPSRLSTGAPSTQHYDVAAAACPLAPRNRYLPAWSGCVTARVADLSGDGRRDLILVYSRLGHSGLTDLAPRLHGPSRAVELYPAEQAMLRVVSPDGLAITTPIEYTAAPSGRTPARIERAAAAAPVSIAHVNDDPGKEIFLQIEQISSGSTAVAYGLDRDRLVSAGALLQYGGDSATQAGFQCLAGSPPRLIQHGFELIRPIRLIHRTIYGRWNETTTIYAWRGPRLVKLSQSTVGRRALPTDRVGEGCTRGIG